MLITGLTLANEVSIISQNFCVTRNERKVVEMSEVQYVLRPWSYEIDW